MAGQSTITIAAWRGDNTKQSDEREKRLT